MCGILGVAGPSQCVSTQVLIHMRDVMQHRGPDDAGIWVNGQRSVGLAHRRLSIIDLSSAGRQPMCDDTGRIWITYNGEIYNFQDLRCTLQRYGWRFRTDTDTEVILYAYRQWGEKLLGYLNGMFAFGIYDCEKHRLVLARDRLGQKPLYYFQDGQQLVFASESKAILPIRNERWPLDFQALNFFFAFGYVPGKLSAFEKICKLLPGHYLTYDVDTGKCQTHAYWTPPFRTSFDGSAQDAGAFLDKLEALLEDSVRLRLISDVPLGILLSGGVDSSLVTAMADRVSSQRVKTFTISFPGEGDYNEGPYASLVADYFGTEHLELPIPESDLDTLHTVAAHLDEPLADPSILPTYLLSELTRQYVTVALGGDGGDELFGGYTWYRLGLQAQRIFTRVPRFVRQATAAAASAMPIGLTGRSFIRSLAGDLCYHMTANTSIFDLNMRRQLFSPDVLEALGDSLNAPERYKRSLWLADTDAVLQMSALDLRSFLPDDILFKVDRASMAFGLEVRTPWLDYRLVEFALTQVPSTLKVNGSNTRILQRKLAERLLPSTLDLDRKQGFVMPIHQWMNGEWGDLARKYVSDPELCDLFNAEFVGQLLEGQRHGYTNGVRLFACLMFGLWHNSVSAMV